MSKFPHTPPTQEMIDDWKWFDEYVIARIRAEFEKNFVAEEKRLEDEFLNGTPEKKPVGFLPAGYAPE